MEVKYEVLQTDYRLSGEMIVLLPEEFQSPIPDVMLSSFVYDNMKVRILEGEPHYSDPVGSSSGHSR